MKVGFLCLFSFYCGLGSVWRAGETPSSVEAAVLIRWKRREREEVRVANRHRKRRVEYQSTRVEEREEVDKIQAEEASCLSINKPPARRAVPESLQQTTTNTNVLLPLPNRTPIPLPYFNPKTSKRSPRFPRRQSPTFQCRFLSHACYLPFFNFLLSSSQGEDPIPIPISCA